MKKLPQQGDKIEFTINNPNWTKPLSMEGVVESSSGIFGGMIHVKEGVVTKEEMIVKLGSVK